MIVGYECLSCDADEQTCAELSGCCTRCDHRPDPNPALLNDLDLLEDPALPDDVALPGLEHDEPRRWSKTQRGYLAHMARLEYPDGWTFWSVCLSTPELDRERGPHTADEVETAFLIRGDEIRRALIVIGTGEVLAHTEEPA